MKYAVENIATEAKEGRTVLICGARTETQYLLELIEQHAKEGVAKRYRAHGRESIEMHSGGRIIPANSPGALRGYSANTVYLCPSINSRTPYWAENAFVAVNASGGEVIPI